VSEERQCPGCAEPVGPADRYCEGCGTDLLVRRTPVGGAEGPASGACPACDSAEFTDGFCAQCGRAQPAGRDRMEFDLGAVAGVGDRGKHRARNEDSMAFALLDTPRSVAAVVCDGVASTERADQASQAAADTALDVLAGALLNGATPRTALVDSVDAAMTQVTKLAEREPPGSAPSCTFVAAIVGDGTVTVGWVGDSRAYWLSGRPDDQGGARLTDDDSWAGQIVASGVLSEAEAEEHPNAHVITAWLGADATDLDPHVRTFTPDGAGVVLVCSDGLWNYLPDAAELARELTADAAAEPLAAARSLTRFALDAGGRDNVTVVVVPFPPSVPTTQENSE
jgi:serine/threonine protein phosphatase PrpC